MAILSSTGISGFLSSARATGKQILNKAGKLIPEYIEDFVSGFAGHGWKIWNYRSETDSENKELKKYKLEIDSITVRESMTVFELLIQKIRAVKGALSITQASGKVATALFDEDTSEWLLTVEDEMSFVAHDIIRCQSWDNGTLKGYWVEISEIRKIEGVDTIIIPAGEFSGGIGYDKSNNNAECVDKALPDMITPAAGDEIIQFGNSKVANRQSAVYIHADEGGQPAIDILFGIKSKSFAGCVKQRIGGDIPGTDGLKGFYCENGMIKGTDETGHTVYCIYPDGTAEFGDGSAKFATDKSGYIAGGAISWAWNEARGKYVCTMGDVILGWGNLDDDVKENIKGEPGKDGKDGTNGVPGPPGKDGKVYYTWIRYADTSSGGGISNDPTGKTFIGLAYNKETATESNTASDYSWSRFRGFDGSDGADGKNGNDGVPGPPGTDGKTTYTWIAYSDYADGSGMYQLPNKHTKYIGIAVNKDTATESGNPSVYRWSKCRGDDAIVYELVPSSQIFVLSNTGIFRPKFVTCKVKKIQGDTYTMLTDASSLLAEGLRLEYSMDDGGDGAVDVEPMERVYPKAIITYINFILLRNGDIIDKKEIRVCVDGQEGTPGEDANLLPWIEKWNGYATELGEEYIVTPKMFSGVRNEDGTLTGVTQGKDCIIIDGIKHSGLFGLKNGDIVFSIDDAGKVNTTGDVIANAIKASGLNINDNFKVDKNGKIIAVDGEFRGTVYATDGVFQGRVETSINGKRFVINPDNKAIQMYDSLNRLLFSIRYANVDNLNTSPVIEMSSYKEDSSTIETYTEIKPGSIYMSASNTVSSDWNSKALTINTFGITFYKDGKTSRSYPSE